MTISSGLYLFSFQAKHSLEKYKLQSETNKIDRVDNLLAILNKSMGQLEEEPKKENFNRVKKDLAEFMRSDLSAYEPWFPEKKVVLLDSLDILFTTFESFKDLGKAISTEEFKDLRIKLLETEIYYSKLLKYNIEKSITYGEYEIRLNESFRILNLLSGILLSLGMLTLYLGIRKIKTTRPNNMQ